MSIRIAYSKISVAGKKVTVRSYRFSDFKNCLNAHAARLPKVNDFDNEIPASKDKNPGEFKKRIRRHREIAKNGHHYIFGVFENKSGDFVGQVDFFVINKQLRWGNLGYVIHNHHWSKGYATEASRLALKIAFKKLGFHRIEAATEIKNKASIKVAKRAGLFYEGKRKRFFPENGGIDMVVYATNAIDYKRR